jgi:hypothetical protein
LSENTDFSKLSVDDIRVVSEAMRRFEYTVDTNGEIKLITLSGLDINVSENIYVYIKHFLTTPKTRCIVVENETDCVARCISYVKKLDYNKVNDWIVSNYGNNGVPESEFYTVVSHFGEGNQQNSEWFREMYFTRGQTMPTNMIVVIGGSHAVVPIQVYNIEVFIVYDPQYRDFGFYDIDAITHIFQYK